MFNLWNPSGKNTNFALKISQEGDFNETYKYVMFYKSAWLSHLRLSRCSFNNWFIIESFSQYNMFNLLCGTWSTPTHHTFYHSTAFVLQTLAQAWNTLVCSVYSTLVLWAVMNFSKLNAESGGNRSSWLALQRRTLTKGVVKKKQPQTRITVIFVFSKLHMEIRESPESIFRPFTVTVSLWDCVETEHVPSKRH